MRNNHPKSENPAIKEQAARDKDRAANQKSTEAEKAQREHPPRGGTPGASKTK